MLSNFERWLIGMSTTQLVVLIVFMLMAMAILCYLINNLAALRRVARRITRGKDYMRERYDSTWMTRKEWEDTCERDELRLF